MGAVVAGCARRSTAGSMSTLEGPRWAPAVAAWSYARTRSPSGDGDAHVLAATGSESTKTSQAHTTFAARCVQGIRRRLLSTCLANSSVRQCTLSTDPAHTVPAESMTLRLQEDADAVITARSEVDDTFM